MDKWEEVCILGDLANDFESAAREIKSARRHDDAQADRDTERGLLREAAKNAERIARKAQAALDALEKAETVG